MQISVHNIPSEILVTTVSVKHNPNNPLNVYLFRCLQCGTGITQINGDIVKISAGREPSQDVAVINQCYKCRHYYIFQTRTHLPKESIRLVLPVRSVYNLFRCVICRTQLLEYNKTSVYLLPQHLSKVYPFDFDCVGHACSVHYSLVDMVE